MQYPIRLRFPLLIFLTCSCHILYNITMFKQYVSIMILLQTLVIINVDTKKPQLYMEIPNTNLKMIMKDEESGNDDIRNELLKKGQFFRDLFSEQLSEHEIEFGHVCENPDEWEQRFERKDMKKNSYQGKIKWGNKNGDYGEHYWDLNH